MTHNNSGPISHPQAHPSNQLLMLSILLISLVLGGGIVERVDRDAEERTAHAGGRATASEARL